MKFKFVLITVLLFTTVAFVAGQGNQLGKIVYLEGNVTLLQNGNGVAAAINTIVYNHQQIKTAAKSTAEIQWSSGAKTIVEPSSQYTIQSLFDQSSSQVLTQSENVFAGFKKAFKQVGESKRVEVGGIRRSKSKVDTLPAAHEVYWKEDQEVSFEEAAAYYDKGDFTKAAWAFKTFLDQKPMSDMAKYATFALGHSYLKINNQQKAKEVFEQFIVRFSNDELRAQADLVLAKFPTAH